MPLSDPAMTLPASSCRFLRSVRGTSPLAGLVALLLLGFAGCALRSTGGGTAAAPQAEPAPALPPAEVQAQSPGLFAQEPTIGVLLAQGREVAFTTLVDGQIGDVGLAPGWHHATRTAAGLAIDGQPCPGTVAVRLASAGPGQARFRAPVQPPHGQPSTLALAGEPLLVAMGGEIQLIERVPLETYLAGVLPSEMSPRWPLAALEAQAVAARSYACARIVQRAGQPWQLHWHFSVDMAYGGVLPATPVVAEALRATRGFVLEREGQPLACLFCASSGGRTESAEHLASQGMISGLPVVPGTMPVVEDPADQAGAEGLGKSATHWRWTAQLSYAQLSTALEPLLRSQPGLAGARCEIIGLRPASVYPDSGRVAEVALRVRALGRLHQVLLPAARFRLAAGPGLVRSVWWDRCVPLDGGRVLIAGRGFGHGVGMSQVSAWAMANAGSSGSEILQLFYRDSSLDRLYP